MIQVGRIFKDYDHAGAMNALVGVQTALDDRTFLTKRGDLLTVLSISGVDYECLDPSQLDQTARCFEGAIRAVDEPFRLYQYMLKRDQPEIPHRHYGHPVVQEAIDGRMAYLHDRAATLYSLDLFTVVSYEGWREDPSWRDRLSRLVADPKRGLRQLLSSNAYVAHLEDGLDKARDILAAKVDSVVVQLQGTLDLEVLDKQRAYRFFRRLVNYAPYKSDAAQLTSDRFIDFQACDSALECHRDHLRQDDYFVKVLTLKEPPSHTVAHLLRGLHEIPSNCIIASEWKRMDNFSMRRQIQSMRRHFHNSKSSMANYLASGSQTGPQDLLIDDGAVAMVADLGGCLEELEVRGHYFGEFSLTVVLYDLDWTRLQRSVAECFKVFATHDGRVVEERYNLLNAWLSVLPGNPVYNLRRLWLLNSNYADLSFLFGQRMGEPVNAHLGTEYLAVFETESGTPYLLNLHYQDVAHTMILGATGSGKSFLLNFLLTQLQKYEPFTYIFDLGGGYESLTRLFDGVYVRIAVDDPAFSINPFCLPPTAENLHFVVSFCRVLIESGGYHMTAADERDLTEQVENVYAVEPEQRRLLTLANIVNRDLRPQLHKWVEGGAYARWFDNASDTLTMARYMAFDFEGMDKYPQVLEALVFYILHRANAVIYDAAVASTFKVFVLDEAWRFFRHPGIKRYIVEALKTWRKKNAAMILATQSVDDLRASDLLPIVIESCATKLFLANPGLDRNAYREIFHLNETETERIAALIPKRQMLVKRPDLAKVLNLNVDPKQYWLYTNSPYDNLRKREVFERHGVKLGLDLLGRSPAHEPLRA